MLIHNRRYSTLMMELVFKHPSQRISYSTPGGNLTVRNIEGHKKRTGFETDTSPSILNGVERVIPTEALEKLKKECAKHDVKWHDNAFAKSIYTDSRPYKDIALLSKLCRSIENDVSTIITWYRNQTEKDNRPNKHLTDYPGLSDLCKIAKDGFQSRVSDFTAPRPFTKNHQSAVQRSDAVQRKLVKEAMMGKTLILEHDTASARDGNSSE